MPLKVVIIGSGVAGLASAAVLRHSAEVKIIERGNTARIAGGQGIGLGPNAVKILDALGWDRERVQAVVCQGLKAYDAGSGKLVKTIHTDDPQKWGANWTVQLRSDLREELARLATEDGPGETPSVLYETKVTDIDTESGIVTLENGQHILSDVIIGESSVFFLLIVLQYFPLVEHLEILTRYNQLLQESTRASGIRSSAVNIFDLVQQVKASSGSWFLLRMPSRPLGIFMNGGIPQLEHIFPL